MPVAEVTFFIMFLMFMVSMVFAAVFMIGFMLLALLTPAMTYLKARMKHMPLLAVRRRDRKIHMIRADTYIEGLATCKTYGGYIIDPDSVYSEKKSGVPILPVNAEIGITLSEDVLVMIDGLKQMGYSNIEEAIAANAVYGQCSCSYTGFMDYQKDKDGKAINKTGEVTGNPEELVLVCPHEKVKEVEDVRKEVEKEEAEAVQETETIQEPHGSQGDETGLPDSGAGPDV